MAPTKPIRRQAVDSRKKTLNELSRQVALRIKEDVDAIDLDTIEKTAELNRLRMVADAYAKAATRGRVPQRHANRTQAMLRILIKEIETTLADQGGGKQTMLDAG
jgi:hypothetical protein